MKPIVMLFSMSFEPFQGRYLRVYNEAKTLIQHGYAVTILAWDRKGKATPTEVVDGIIVHRIRVRGGDRSIISNTPNFFLFFVKAFRYLMVNKFNVIHCHNLLLLPLASLTAKLKGVKLIFDACEPDYYALWPKMLHSFVKKIEKLLAKSAHYVIVHNDYQVKKYKNAGISMVKLIGSYPSSSMVVASPKIREKQNSTTIIGRIGTIYEDNGIEELLEAFKILIFSEKENIRLVLAGRVVDTFLPTFKKLISGLEDYIDYYGSFSSLEMTKFYKKVDISIMLYRRTEWFQNITPTKFFDSLACGVPVVVSDIGGLRQFIAEYPCGVVVDETNPKDICRGIQSILHKSIDLRRHMVENGLRLIRERCNWDLMAESFLQIYKGVEAP